MKYILIILVILNTTFCNVFADIINKIEVKNNKRITKESIITFSGIKFGKDYTQDPVSYTHLTLPTMRTV